MQGGSYGKVVSHVIIGLKTVKGAKQLKLDPTIYDSLQKEKVRFGSIASVANCCKGFGGFAGCRTMPGERGSHTHTHTRTYACKNAHTHAYA